MLTNQFLETQVLDQKVYFSIHQISNVKMGFPQFTIPPSASCNLAAGHATTPPQVKCHLNKTCRPNKGRQKCAKQNPSWEKRLSFRNAAIAHEMSTRGKAVESEQALAPLHGASTESVHELLTFGKDGLPSARQEQKGLRASAHRQDPLSCSSAWPTCEERDA